MAESEESGPRRSTRVKSAPKRPLAELKDEQEVSDTRKPRKRVKKTRLIETTSTSFNDKFKFVELPVEIIDQILGEFYLLSLFRLAHCNKELRGYLKHLPNDKFWKQARERDPEYRYPPRLPWISEIKWAYLLLVPRCHECNKTLVETIDWTHAARWCIKCEKSVYTLEKLRVPSLKHPLLSQLRKMRFGLPKSKRGYLKANFAELDLQITTALSVAQVAPAPEEEIRKQIEAIESSWNERGRFARKNATSATAYHQWNINSRGIIRTLQQSRWTALRSRLQAEGLTEGIKSYTLEQATKNFPDIIMGIRENISNTEWDQEKGRLVEYFTARRERLVQRRDAQAAYRAVHPPPAVVQDRLKTFYAALSDDYPDIKWKAYMVDVALLPELRLILEKPTKDPLSKEQLAHMNILELVRKIKEQRERTILQSINQVLGKDDIPLNPGEFKLGRTMIACKSCHELLFHHRLVTHKCHVHHSSLSGVDRKDPYDVSLKQNYGRSWTVDSLDIGNSLSKTIAVIGASGMDPGVATRKDVAKFSALLRCINCQSRRKNVQPMSLEKAITHALTVHRRTDEIEWELAVTG